MSGSGNRRWTNRSLCTGQLCRWMFQNCKCCKANVSFPKQYKPCETWLRKIFYRRIFYPFRISNACKWNSNMSDWKHRSFGIEAWAPHRPEMSQKAKPEQLTKHCNRLGSFHRAGNIFLLLPRSRTRSAERTCCPASHISRSGRSNLKGFRQWFQLLPLLCWVKAADWDRFHKHRHKGFNCRQKNEIKRTIKSLINQPSVSIRNIFEHGSRRIFSRGSH